MTAESSTPSSRSGEPSPDRYIGSFINLTSKSEIRYEGILYNINTDEASIGLRNVRSYGTEGRKTDGPQVPPSDKVYEYILFRGSDIKFLQVKASPPAEATPPSINSDPAIIQSHFPGATMPPTSLPTASSAHLTDLGSHSPQMSPTFQSGLPTAPNPYLTNLGSHSSKMGPTFQSGLPTAPSGNLTDLGSHSSQMGSTFQSGEPLHQPGGNMNSWGASPPNMPMYWPGYYGTPNWTPQMSHHSLLHPPHGLPAPPLQNMQFSGFNPSLPISSTLPSSNLPEYHSLDPNSTSSSNLTSSSLPASSFSLNAPPLQPMALPSIYNFMPNQAQIPTITTSAPGSSLPSLTSLSTSVPYTAPVPSLVSKPIVATGPSAFASQTLSSLPIRTESTTPSLITPAELLQPVPQPLSVPMTQKEELLQPVPPPLPVQMTQKEELLQPVPQPLPVPMTQKDVEVVQVSAKKSSEPLGPVVTKAQPPLLPLPTNAGPHKSNGSSYHHMHSRNRGRGGRGGPGGRGPGVSRPVSKFTEEFDFMAMNEKFNKDEVWGHLGKSNKFKDENNFGSDEDVHGTESPKIEIKPVYKKDDFFDSLSSNTLDNGPNHVRPRYSEQLKLDTETFGDFSSYRGGRGGGRGYSRGRSHGGYGDRGRGGGEYGDMGRGRGGYGGRGRGGYEDRGSGRGRGGYEDRGSGRGRGGYEDRGSGRGRGGYEDRGSGRGRGGYEDRGRGSGA